MTAAPVAGTWVRRFHPARPGAPRLVCLPHAGGSASFFHPLSSALAPDVEVLAVQYPGRQDRRREAPLADLAALADAIAESLPPFDVPTALFGHSMGAILGYELALRREAIGAGPLLLVASGRRAPSSYRDEAVHLLDDHGLIEEIRQLEGTGARVLGDPEILESVMEALRGDLRAIETYRHEPGRTLRCPITVLVGDDDPKTTLAEARAWAAHTTSRMDLRQFSGGHFYLVAHADPITRLLREQLAPQRTTGGPQ